LQLNNNLPVALSQILLWPCEKYNGGVVKRGYIIGLAVSVNVAVAALPLPKTQTFPLLF
jgi:hypothetical protein